MVCNRCKIVVQTELIRLGLHPISVELGVIEVADTIDHQLRQQELAEALQQFGFELLVDKRKQLVEQLRPQLLSWFTIKQHR